MPSPSPRKLFWSRLVNPAGATKRQEGNVAEPIKMTSGGASQQTSEHSPRRQSEWGGGTVRSLRRLTSASQMIGGWRSNFLLFAVTLVELVVLLRLTTTFTVVDWIYLSQNILVLGISLTRRRPIAQDQSWPTSLAVAVSYSYPYAQVIYLNSMPGYVAWPAAGAVLVTLSAFLSLSALLSIGKLFGVRPAMRGLTVKGPYRLVRHPMYLAYFVADIGYQLQEWNMGTVAIVAAGWASLVYRIYAEERMLSLHPDWAAYVGRVRRRLIPGVW
jgi:protein-S-isoprenylcysteine O-methyltransferase Ste14